jgi:glycosyltransferase involved in cell wall biosynthesis
MDARVARQVDFLADEHQVVVAALGSSPDLPAFEFAALSPRAARRPGQSVARAARRWAGRYESAYWLDPDATRWRAEIEALLPVDAIVVNQLFILPIANAVASGAAVIFDSQEHWTSESASWTRMQRLSMRRAHEWIVDSQVPRTAGMMAVSEGIVRDYERRAGVRPALITNAPRYHPLEPTAVGEPIRLVHVGAADERRRLEDTIDAVLALDERFTLDLILVWENEYRRRLERQAGSDGRVRFLPPVPNKDLIPAMNRYDIGVFLLPAKFPNQVHVLPNKLFDYIQARLAVAISPSPEMARVVEQWECGVVSRSFTAHGLTDALRPLDTAAVERMKRNSHRAAKVLTAENNRNAVLAIVREAIARARTGATA